MKYMLSHLAAVVRFCCVKNGQEKMDYKLRYPQADTVKKKKDGTPYANGAKEKAYVYWAYKDCLSRPCFRLMYHKGSFYQGIGYTRYYDKPQLVCGERHLNGCPELLDREKD
jgi:hypothetical protein